MEHAHRYNNQAHRPIKQCQQEEFVIVEANSDNEPTFFCSVSILMLTR